MILLYENLYKIYYKDLRFRDNLIPCVIQYYVMLVNGINLYVAQV